ncbi:hypothetical protein AMECASPLE_003795 [Ameca splendens]|uniref:Uncharacterized protein n=1 Tax=Ameca splendens TaxID=208324 RepID=A0ABV0YKR1_9TELE
MSPQVCASSSSSGSNSPPGGDEWTAQPLSSPLHTVADISCKSSGSFPSYEVTFHVPRASLSIQRSGFRGLHLLSAANPLCTGPSWTGAKRIGTLQVVGPLGDGLASLIQAWPGWVLQGVSWSPGARR